MRRFRRTEPEGPAQPDSDEPASSAPVEPQKLQTKSISFFVGSTHIGADYAPLEATRYATRTFKRLMYHTCENPHTFLQPVTAEIEAFEETMLREQRRVVRDAERNFQRGGDDEARAGLDEYVNERLLDALDLGEALVDAVEERTREEFGICMPTGRLNPGETWRPGSQSMNRGGGLTGPANNIVFCYRPDIDTSPREHGSYANLRGDLLRGWRPQSAGFSVSGLAPVTTLILGVAIGAGVN